MKTSEIFKNELGYIKNDTLREIVAETLDSAPECIQIIPASSSMKYHPQADIIIGEVDENGYVIKTGGLVNHIKAVVGVANSLISCDIFKNLMFGTEYDVSKEDIDMYADIAYASLILHDCMKPDDTPKHSTRFDHPTIASELFLKISKFYLTNSFVSKEDIVYMKDVIPMIKGCIASHMGQWNTATYAKGIVLPTPSNNIEVFVHMCDYLASRKFIDFNFEKYKG